jgi:subtilisin family serine protease
MKAITIIILAFVFVISAKANRVDSLYAPYQLIARLNGNAADMAREYVLSTDTAYKDSCMSILNGLLDSIGVYSVSTIFYYDPEADTNYFEEYIYTDFVVYYSDTTDSVMGRVNQLSTNYYVEFVHPNYLLESFSWQPDDPKWSSGTDGQEVYLNKIKLLEAWEIQKGCTDINVAVIDHGFRDLDHPDMANKFTATQFDATDVSPNGITAYGGSPINGEDYYHPDYDVTGNHDFHGLHCASVLAANPNNNKGMVGVAWRNKIIPVRAGFAYYKNLAQTATEKHMEYDDFARALSWVVQMKDARVVSMSVGFIDFTNSSISHPSNYPSCEYILDKGVSEGIVFVCAAGNDAPYLAYPATSQHTISTGAMHRDFYTRTTFSSFGDSLDIMAVGHEVWVCHRNSLDKYLKVEGTSFSTPMVAGGAALILSQNSDLNQHYVRAVLTRTAYRYNDDLVTNEFTTKDGYGLMNLERALKAVPQVQSVINLDNENIDSIKIVHAQSGINAGDNLSISNGAFVEFKAGSYINLQPGFSASPGTDYYSGIFAAFIGKVNAPCIGGGARYASVIGDINDDEFIMIKSESRLFPNPATINVNLTGLDYNVSTVHAVVLVSTLGVEMKYLMYRISNHYENTLSIDLDGIPPGVYFLKTLAGSQINMYKIIVSSL